MHFCFSTLGCSSMDFDDAAALARRYRSALELRFLGGSRDLAGYLRGRFQNPGGFARHVEQTGIPVDMIDTSLNLLGGEAERAAFLELAPWADAAGVRWLRIFDGFEYMEELPGEVMERMAELIGWWRGERSRNGWNVDIAVETHDAFCSSGNCLRLQTALPEPVAILWDAHHTWFRAGESLPTTWAALAPFVCHVHFKDSLPQPSDRHPYTYHLPGAGNFPLDELVTLLGNAGFGGALSLEWEREWHPYMPPLEDALDAFEHLRPKWHTWLG